MTPEQLSGVLESWENLDFTIKECVRNPEYIEILMEIALNSNKEKSWRAAWVADKIHEINPYLVQPYLTRMIARLETESDKGKLRHFLKLISLNKIPPEKVGFLLDLCLRLMVSDKEPPAIRVHAMQILYNISQEEPGLKPEILAVIENEIELHPTPGIQSRGAKLVKKLRNELEI